jgi:hypothetical protein
MGASFKIAEAFVEFVGKDAPLMKTFEEVKRKLDTFGQRLGQTMTPLFQGSGPFGAAQLLAIQMFGKGVETVVRSLVYLVGQMREAVTWARDMRLIAQMSRTDTESLQRLGLAGAISGVGAGQMSGAAVDFRREMRDSMHGLGTAQYAAQILGVKLRDASGRLRELIDVIPDVVQELARFDAYDQDVIARALFGGGAQPVLEAVRVLGKDLKNVRAEAELFQTTISQKLVDSLDELNKPWRILEEQLSTMWKAVSAMMAPIVEGALRVLNIVVAIFNAILKGLALVATTAPKTIGILMMLGGVAFGNPLAFLAGAAMLVGGMFGGNNNPDEPDRALGKGQLQFMQAGSMTAGVGLTGFQEYFAGALRAFAGNLSTDQLILEELRKQTNIMMTPQGMKEQNMDLNTWEAQHYPRYGPGQGI